MLTPLGRERLARRAHGVHHHRFRRRRHMRLTVSVACATLVASFACGGNHDSNARGTAADTHADAKAGAAATANQPMTLEGCLQRGGGTFSNGFLLTMLNEPAGVGTSGSLTRTGSSVEREQLR